MKNFKSNEHTRKVTAETIILTKAAGFQFTSLLKIDSIINIFEDFAYL